MKNEKLFKIGVELIKVSAALAVVAIALPLAGVIAFVSWEMLKAMPK